jgi:membrane-associated phospholipid phosphatase
MCANVHASKLTVVHPAAGKLVSDAAIVAGGAGWLAAGAAALAGADARAARHLAISVAVYVAGGGSVSHGDPLLVSALKGLFHRARPSAIHSSFAFPSGHTTAATFIVGTLLYVLLPVLLQRDRGEGPTLGAALARARPWVWAGGAALTAAGRVLADAHWVSDVAAGACLGSALVAATALACGASDLFCGGDSDLKK